MNTGIVILAAGESKRMGSPKQLLLLNGKSMIKSIVEVALETNCYPIVVVLGANRHIIREELDKMPITIIDNADWEKGMSSSIKIGLAGQYMTKKDIESVIFMTADMPLVTSDLLNTMAEIASQSPEIDIVACAYGSQVGIPVLFKRKLFSELLDLTGDEGAKKIVKANIDKTKMIEFTNGLIDLDTKEDYQNFVANKNPN